MKEEKLFEVYKEDEYICIHHGLDTWWFNLKSFSIVEAILRFLSESGIEKVDKERINTINESNEFLLEKNKELNNLLTLSLDLVKTVQLHNEQLRKLLFDKTFNK